jgi:hypothetical protein
MLWAAAATIIAVNLIAFLPIPGTDGAMIWKTQAVLARAA